MLLACSSLIDHHSTPGFDLKRRLYDDTTTIITCCPSHPSPLARSHLILQSSIEMSAMPELDIRQLDDYVTVFDIPFSRFGILPIGNRSTSLKLSGDRLFVVVSSPCDEPTKAKLATLGTVS